MGFCCGIVGLPNVGKSTLFNALTSTQSAAVGNYPFCTVDPHIGKVPIFDAKLNLISSLTKSKNTIPTQIEIVDIAGLVKGANEGEGLGNQFLGNIREVDAILHMVRCFDDKQISHVEGRIDPLRDIDLIETELLLADLESLEKQYANLEKKAKGGNKEAIAAIPLAEELINIIKDGNPARKLNLKDDQKKIAKSFQLLTSKPVVYICNVEEDNASKGNLYSNAVENRASEEQSKCIIISAAIEAEIAGLEDLSEKTEFLDSLGLKETGLNRVIEAGYNTLNLIRYYTAGPKESRAWTIKNGMTAKEAAGVIHSDFSRGFICAETISFEHYISLGGEQAAKEAGKMRQEGRDYIVQDRDILLFRFNI